MGGLESPGLAVAVVCSSNMNRQATPGCKKTPGKCQLAASHVPSLIRIHCRSMEAHARLSKKGFNVASFGTGDKVRTRRLEMEM